VHPLRVPYVGLDDTDSRRASCTTWVATEVVREFGDWDLLCYPRLVRLNPNVPWKTRGNGAVSLRFGRGRGDPFPVGRVDGRPIQAFPRGALGDADADFEVRLRRILERECAFEDPTTHPGYAILRRRPGPGLYWAAVRRIVTVDEALAAASGCGRTGGYKEGRGRIGALAAIAWRPRDRTYEILAYRDRALWGSRRAVDEASVVEMDRRFPSTFNNYDAENGHVVLAPNSPCPVLLGIRGDRAADLPDALRAVTSEPFDRWMLFETNQGTDDHLIPADGGDLVPRTSVIVEGVVAANPWTRPGGHVVFPLARTRGDAVDCVAYEPSKQFRRVVRALRTGDRVRACGAVREMPRAINLEKLAVLSVASGPRPPAVGWYEPPASARRHLAKPLKRFPPALRPGLRARGTPPQA